MTNIFDDEAKSYDLNFTYSPIGRIQRELVWKYLEKIFPELKGNEVLELNCGTGEDAIYLAGKNYHVMATDNSEKMLEMARLKASNTGKGTNISFQCLDLNKIDHQGKRKFDLVFSNFGGINCIDKETIQKILIEIANILKPGGRFVAVIMPKFCLWEFLFFTIKLNFPKALRRLKKKSTFSIGAHSFPVWYHSPPELKRYCGGKFLVRHYQPIGFMIPPSYLNATFSKRKKLLSQLEKAENKLNQIQWLSNLSDHFLIDLQLK